MKELPSQEYLQECFEYDPYTGFLYWKRRPRKHFKIEQSFNAFNTRYCGKLALNSIDTNGYKYGILDSVPLLAHRVIWKLWYGTEPNYILHTKGDKTNNRIEKLSSGTPEDNMKDSKRYRTNRTGITGIHWSKNKWRAQIGVCGKTVYLGMFDDLFEACCVRKSAERKYGFHLDHGREAI